MVKQFLFAFSLFISGIFYLNSQSKIYVDISNSSGIEDGTNWSSAYVDFQEAINASLTGDSIFVAGGTYQPVNSFYIPEGLKIYGGFAGTETSLLERDLTTGYTSILLSRNGNNVVGFYGSTANMILNGFTITGASNGSHGIYNNGASPTIVNCTFYGNSGTTGGAIHNTNGASPTIINCIFYKNKAIISVGGAIYNYNSSPVITNCVFFGNDAGTYGGAIYNDNSSPVITNCIFYKNTSIGNSTIHNIGTSLPIITYSLIQGLGEDIVLHNVDGTTGDPFVDSNNPAGSDGILGTTDDGLALACNSLGINAGNNSILSTINQSFDITGGIRIQNGTIDLGPYEKELPEVTANASATTICSGDTLILTGSGATGYIWDNGVIDGENTFPTDTTTYTVIGTGINGCTNNAQITVNVPKSTVTANASATTICAGDTLILTGGGSTSYTWNNGITDGESIFPTETKTYTVTGEGASGCNKAQVTINVKPLPNVTANASVMTICVGDTSLILTGEGASTYVWDNGALNGEKVFPTDTTTYTVAGTDINGCTKMAQITINVKPLLPVTANASSTAICIGDPLILTGSGATDYIWDHGVTDGESIFPTDTTTYTVIGTGANGCRNTAQITVSVKPLPVVNLTNLSLCDDNFSTVLDAGNSGASYLWSDNSTNQTLTADSFGTYSVKVTSSSGCSTTESMTIFNGKTAPVTGDIVVTQISGCQFEFSVENSGSVDNFTWNFGYENAYGKNVTYTFEHEGDHQILVNMSNACGTSITKSIFVDCNSMGVEKLQITDINLYPNPASAIITIENNGIIEVKHIAVINMLGQIIFETIPENTLKDQLNISEFSDGFYTIQIQTTQGLVVKKIEVKK